RYSDRPESPRGPPASEFYPVSASVCSERLQPSQLAAGFIEIAWIEPGNERRPDRRFPLVIEHGEPCRIAIASLDDHVLPEDSLEGESKPERRLAGTLVQGVALPFVAAVAQRP